MKIANVLLNNFLNDSQVIKTSNSLLQLGNEVLVVAMVIVAEENMAEGFRKSIVSLFESELYYNSVK